MHASYLRATTRVPDSVSNDSDHAASRCLSELVRFPHFACRPTCMLPTIIILFWRILIVFFKLKLSCATSTQLPSCILMAAYMSLHSIFLIHITLFFVGKSSFYQPFGVCRFARFTTTCLIFSFLRACTSQNQCASVKKFDQSVF